jgi:DNA primase
VIPLIEDIPNAIERDTYRQRLARSLRVDERSLLNIRQYRPTRGRYHRKATPEESTLPVKLTQDVATATNKREVHILGALIRSPDLIYRIDRHLQEDGLPRLGEQDFETTDHQILINLLIKSLDQNDIEPLDHVLNHLSDPMMIPTDVILEQTEDINPDGDDLLEDVLRALVMLREHQISQQLDHLRFLLESSQENGDLKAVEYQDTMLKYATLRGRLHKARNRYTHRVLSDKPG